LLEEYSGKEESIFINNIVLCELVWVLTRAYKYPKEEIIRILKILFSTMEFCFERHALVNLAVLEYQASSADFSDILIGIFNDSYSCSNTISFDKSALETKYFKQAK